MGRRVSAPIVCALARGLRCRAEERHSHAVDTATSPAANEAMRGAIVATLIGLMLGSAIAFFVYGVQPPTKCVSASVGPRVGGGAVEPCQTKPALWPLVIGVGATGAVIGAVSGAAWLSEQNRRN